MQTVRMVLLAADVSERPPQRTRVDLGGAVGKLLALAASAAGVLGWMCGRSVILAFGGSSVVPAAVVITVAVAMALLGAASVYLLDSLFRRPFAGSVRIDPLAPAVRFMPTRWAQAGLIVVAGVLVTPIIACGLTGAAPDALSWATGIVGVPLVLAIAVTWRRFPGLEVSDVGIRGLRFFRRIELSWQELRAVDTSGDRRPRLVIESIDGRRIEVRGVWIGSDPAEVAAVIEHYRMRPSDRELLTVPVTALDWVADSA